MLADDMGGGSSATRLERRASEVARLVTARREALGLTQAELAKRALLSVRTIRNIELGLVAEPRQATLRQIAEVLHIELGQQQTGANDAEICTSDVLPSVANRPDGFVGRACELDRLDTLLKQRPTMPVADGAIPANRPWRRRRGVPAHRSSSGSAVPSRRPPRCGMRPRCCRLHGGL